MCFLAYRLNYAARLPTYLFVISLCICLYTEVLARAQDVESLPEIFYVRGCRDGAAEARETRGCFAARADVRAPGSKSLTPITRVKLSLQGVNLPSKVEDQGNDGVQVVTHRVVLQEHRRPPLFGQEKDEANTRLLGRIVLACDQLTASPVFPTQLLSCELENPLFSLSSVRDMAPQLRRLVSQSVWFDVHLEVRRGGEKVFRTLSVLRRSVELQVSNVTGTEDEAAAEVLTRQAKRMSWEELRRHPLERLYPPSPTSQDSSSRSAKSTGGANDPYDRDPAASDGEVWMELGIGGLKDELLTLFRRAFLSRLPSLAPLARALELQHVRGVILYGPPGNGKTLIARSLFRLLGPDTRLSIVNAAEILSKFIGESEKNLHDIFEGYFVGTSAKEAAAQQAGEEFDRSAHTIRGAGEKESLLVLVIDEFEALFHRRGHSSDESSAKAIYDGVTNTLLSLMDGVQSRNDILVVGLTNRLSAIDAALLRPGRFEVLIEIPPPDTPGREDIFFIHTERLREQNLLAPDVVMRDLALESGGFSGSDIAGTVRSAISYALLRYRKDDFFQEGLQVREGDQASSETDDAEIIGHRPVDVDGTRLHNTVESSDATSAVSPPKFQVTMEDFERAIRDIRSAKDEGSLFSELSSDGDGFARDLIDHDGTVSRNIERATFLFERVMQSNRTQSGMLAITGAPGSGKSILARALTQLHDFTAVRYFPCRRLVELPNHEEQLIKLRDAFSEASQTERGILVLDDYDVLVDIMGSDGHAAHALRGLLYDYMNHPQGVRRTSAAGSRVATADQAEGGVDGGTMVLNAGRRLAAGRRHRVLVVTSSLSSALHQLSFDARLHVHPVLRSRAAGLLQAYRVVAPALTAKAVAAYPVSMSYRTFLRVTDISLQQWVRGHNDGAAAVNGDSSAGDLKTAGSRRELPAFFATSVSTPAAYEEMQAKQVAGNFYALQDDAACRSFVAAVRTTVNHMGLMDPYQGWGGEGSDDAGSSVDSADGQDREGEETVDVDELVGVGDELLW